MCCRDDGCCNAKTEVQQEPVRASAPAPWTLVFGLGAVVAIYLGLTPIAIGLATVGFILMCLSTSATEDEADASLVTVVVYHPSPDRVYDSLGGWRIEPLGWHEFRGGVQFSVQPKLLEETRHALLEGGVGIGYAELPDRSRVPLLPRPQQEFLPQLKAPALLDTLSGWLLGEPEPRSTWQVLPRSESLALPAPRARTTNLPDSLGRAMRFIDEW